MEFALAVESPFSLDYTLESGQVFRWQKRDDWWYGIVPEGIMKVKQEGDVLRCLSGSDRIDGAYVRKYFRLDVDLQNVISSILKDDTIALAVQSFYGLRLIRQSIWECLASFLLSTNANIPRIRRMVQAICEKFGEHLEFEGTKYQAFPTPALLSEASVAELLGCGLGFRAPFVKYVASSVNLGRVDLGELSILGYEAARESLMSDLRGEKVLPGVGPKVADCVLLYSLEKDEAFPIDVWIARVITQYYPGLLSKELRVKLSLPGKARIGRGDYERMSERVRGYFGPYAGYAQQYLYLAARSSRLR